MTSAEAAAPDDEGGVAHPRGAALAVFLAALRLGLTSFGGPIAHIGYFRHEYVERRRWLSERDFADLVALCQVLPGPASSQVGFGVGMIRAGLLGGVLAWVGFTLPSAVLMIGFAWVVRDVDTTNAGWIAGLQAVAVAVVAQAVWRMARTLTTDAIRIAIAVAATAVLVLVDGAAVQVAVIAAGALAGVLLVRGELPGRDTQRLPARVPRVAAIAALVAFTALLVGLPIVDRNTDSQAVAMSDAYYRSGALVFGGGHVVLPLLEERVVPTGWVAQDDFLAGYGAAQAVPGPLFTFAGFLGAVQIPEPDGIPGGTIALVALFLPAMLLLIGVFPFWDALRTRRGALSAFAGVNAAVVGVLLAALYDPVAKTGLTDATTTAIAAVSLVLLFVPRVPPVAVVAFATAAGALLA